MKIWACAVVCKYIVLENGKLTKNRDINAFFGLKTDLNQKSVDLRMISARHTIIRQIFNKSGLSI